MAMRTPTQVICEAQITPETGMRLCSAIQLCLTLCNPIDCSPPGSSVYGIFQARTLYWSRFPFPPPGDPPNPETEPASLMSPALAAGFFTTKPPGKTSWNKRTTQILKCSMVVTKKNFLVERKIQAVAVI